MDLKIRKMEEGKRYEIKITAKNVNKICKNTQELVFTLNNQSWY